MLVPGHHLDIHVGFTHIFLSSWVRIWAQCWCPSTRSRAQKWALGPFVHTIFVSSGRSTALFSLLSSCFKMASNRVKWSNNKHSHISGTQSVNTTPFCAGTQALVPVHRVDSPLEFMLSSVPHPCYSVGTGMICVCQKGEGGDWLILWGVLLN